MSTIGGFGAVLRIMESQMMSGMVQAVKGGWHPATRATMRLEGRVLEYNWKAPIPNIPLKDIYLIANFEFNETQQSAEYMHFPANMSEEDLKEYIGHIRMYSGGLTKLPDLTGRPTLVVNLGIKLPISFFSQLSSMSEILFETTHTLVEPKSDSTTVALVKTANFTANGKRSNTQ